jgi:TolB protein
VLGTLLVTLAVGASFLATPAEVAGQEVFLSIEKQFGEKVIIAVPTFDGPVSNLVDPQEIREVLSFDLAVSGYFQLVENTVFVDEAEAEDRRSGRVLFAEWLALGTEVLVKGSYESSLGEFALEATLYDPAQGRALFGRRYTGSVEEWRRAVHNLADDIVVHLTGERGIASTRIAFVSSVTGTKEIYVMDYDGANRRRVTKDNAIAIYPDWFPDRRSLVYTRIRGDRQRVCRVDLADGSVEIVTSFPGLNAFASASGRGDELLATLSHDGNPEIYRLRASGSDPRRLTYDRSTESSPCWSPDGRRLAFVSDRGGTPQIYTMSATGGRAERLTYTGNYNTSPDWSPKGDLLVYTSRIDGLYQICTVDVETKEITRLTSGAGNKEDPSWAPDGRHVVYAVKKGGRADLYMLDIYEPQPVRLTSGAGDYLSPAWSP